MDSRVAAKVFDFFKQYGFKKYKKGRYLLIPDRRPKGIFCLQKGIVRCFSLSKSGAELTLNLFKPISFFPMNWVINGKLDRYNYQALEDVEVYIAPKRKVSRFIKQNPGIVYDLLKRIYRGLEGYMLRMESLLSNDAYYRTLAQIIIHTRRFGISEGGKCKLRITHNHLASLAGLRRETVTREIKKLQDKDIVSYQGETMIVENIDRLEQELSGLT